MARAPRGAKRHARRRTSIGLDIQAGSARGGPTLQDLEPVPLSSGRGGLAGAGSVVPGRRRDVLVHDHARDQEELPQLRRGAARLGLLRRARAHVPAVRAARVLRQVGARRRRRRRAVGRARLHGRRLVRLVDRDAAPPALAGALARRARDRLRPPRPGAAATTRPGARGALARRARSRARARRRRPPPATARALARGGGSRSRGGGRARARVRRGRARAAAARAAARPAAAARGGGGSRRRRRRTTRM